MENNTELGLTRSTILSYKNITIISIFLGLVVIVLLAGNLLLKPQVEKNNTAQEDSNSEETASDQELAPGQTNPDIVGFGQTFECSPRSDEEFYRTDATFVIDPKDPMTMFISAEYLGLHKSVDGGKTWKKLTKGIPVYARNEDKNEGCYPEYPFVFIDNKNSNRILLALSGAGGTPKDRNALSSGIAESLDGGETWKQIINDDMNGYVSSMTLDPSDNSIIYYGSNSSPSSYLEADPNKIFVKEGIVYQQKNGEWKELKTGFNPYTGATGVHVNPNNSNELLVFTLSAPKPQGGSRSSDGVEQMGLLRSFDGGETWSASHPLPKGSEAVIIHEISPRNWNNIFVTPFGAPKPSTYFSNDNGKSFTEPEKHIDFAKYDPHDETGNRLIGYAWQGLNGPVENKLFESLDNGTTWRDFGTLPVEIINIKDKKTTISNIVWDPVDKNTIYMTGASALIWKSTNNGQSWTKIADYNTFLSL